MNSVLQVHSAPRNRNVPFSLLEPEAVLAGPSDELPADVFAQPP
jgi:hypothetical protein